MFIPCQKILLDANLKEGRDWNEYTVDLAFFKTFYTGTVRGATCGEEGHGLMAYRDTTRKTSTVALCNDCAKRSGAKW